MTKPRVKHVLTPGGSGNGITHYLTYMKCPRMAYYNELARDARKQDAENNPPPSFKEDKPAFAVGTLYHAFHERGTTAVQFYEADGVTPIAEEDMPLSANPTKAKPNPPTAFEVARDLFNNYPFLRGMGGDVIGCEVYFPMNEGDERRILDAIGLPLTAKMDKVIRFNADAAKFANDVYGLPIREGVYVLDYKTASPPRAGTPPPLERYSNDIQMRAYMLTAEACLAEPVEGTIVSIAYKGYSPSRYETVVIPAPNMLQREQFRNTVATIKRLQTEFHNVPFTAACWQCNYSDVCDRLTTEEQTNG